MIREGYSITTLVCAAIFVILQCCYFTSYNKLSFSLQFFKPQYFDFQV